MAGRYGLMGCEYVSIKSSTLADAALSWASGVSGSEAGLLNEANCDVGPVGAL